LYLEAQEEDKLSSNNKMKGIISKRAQTQNLAPAIIALILAAFFLIFGMIIIQSLRDSDIVDKALGVSVVNETEDRTINETTIYVNTATTNIYGANSYSLDLVYNGTTDITNNFTMDGAGGIVFSDSGGPVNNTADYNISYSFSQGDESYLGANQSLVGMATFADFWEIIVLAIVISVVIGLLLIVFATRRTR